MSVLEDASVQTELTLICREHSHLVVSTLRETFVFSFAAKDTIEHMDPSFVGFAANALTLAVRNIPRRQITLNGVSTYIDSAFVVQITSEGAHLVEYNTALRAFSRTDGGWFPSKVGAPYAGREIVAAATNPSQYLLGLSGGLLVLLNLKNDALQVHSYVNDSVLFKFHQLLIHSCVGI